MTYIILPVHNRKETTRRFMESLACQSYNEFQLILIDDGSTDGTSEMVLNYIPSTTILNGNGSLWWGGCLQKGYEWLIQNADETDICVLINDDTTFSQNFLEIGVQLVSQTENTMLQAQCYCQTTGELIDKGTYYNPKSFTFTQAEEKSQINCLSTRGLFLTIGTLKKINGFKPRLFPHYLSDYDFTYRAFLKDIKLSTNGTLKLYVNQETTGFREIAYTSISDYYSKYFSKRNVFNPSHWIMFIMLYCPFPHKLFHLSRILFKMIKDVLRPFVRKCT